MSSLICWTLLDIIVNCYTLLIISYYIFSVIVRRWLIFKLVRLILILFLILRLRPLQLVMFYIYRAHPPALPADSRSAACHNSTPHRCRRCSLTPTLPITHQQHGIPVWQPVDSPLVVLSAIYVICFQILRNDSVRNWSNPYTLFRLHYTISYIYTLLYCTILVHFKMFYRKHEMKFQNNAPIPTILKPNFLNEVVFGHKFSSISLYR